jgi:hypothetical protein
MIDNYKILFGSIYSQKDVNIEKALQALKENGASQVDSIMILMSELNLSLKEANQIVLNSNAWKFYKSYTEKIREEFGNFLDNLSFPSK